MHLHAGCGGQVRAVAQRTVGRAHEHVRSEPVEEPRHRSPPIKRDIGRGEKSSRNLSAGAVSDKARQGTLAEGTDWKGHLRHAAFPNEWVSQVQLGR